MVDSHISAFGIMWVYGKLVFINDFRILTSSLFCVSEFLNVDDEANYDDAADHDMLNPEEAQSVENSGWSSRTR